MEDYPKYLNFGNNMRENSIWGFEKTECKNYNVELNMEEKRLKMNKNKAIESIKYCPLIEYTRTICYGGLRIPCLE